MKYALLCFSLALTTLSPAMAADTLACFQGDVAARIEACTRAIDGAPTEDIHALVLMSRAEAYVARGESMRALSDYDAALFITPRDTAALIARGHLRHAAGNTTGAEADYTAALDIDATLTDALSKRGDLRFVRGDFAGAAADYESLSRATPATPQMVLRLFITRGRAGLSDREPLTASAAAIRARGWGDDAWPMPLLRYLLGEISGDDALAATQNEPEKLCEAYFILGEAGLLLDDAEEAKKLFAGILTLNAMCPFEKAAGTAELARLISP